MERVTFFQKAKFFAIAGVGYFADGYLNLTISTVLKMLGYLYFQDQGGAMSKTQSGAITASVSVGVILGTILFGFFGDAFGRHSVYGRELLLTIFGNFMTIMLPWNGLSHEGVVAWMAVFRTFLGFGTGGDTPISAALAAEKAGSKGHTNLFLSIFFMNAMGNVAASIMLVILLAGFKERIQSDTYYLQWVWRLLLGLGLIPLVSTVYGRFNMKETTPYQKYVQKDASPTTKKRSSGDQWHDFIEYFSDWRHARTFIAMFIINFLYNFASHGISLNQALILQQIGYGTGKTVFQSMWNTAAGNAIIYCGGYFPGFIFSCHILPYIVPRRVQLGCGMLLVILIYVSWAAAEDHAPPGVLLFFIAFSQFAFHAGPVIIAYMPVELFPTRVRATTTGLCGIGGSISSILISYAFGNIMDQLGLPRVLGLSAGLVVLTFPLLLWIPETKGCTIEDIESDVFYRDRHWKKHRDARNAEDTENIAGDGTAEASAIDEGTVAKGRAGTSTIAL